MNTKTLLPGTSRKVPWYGEPTMIIVICVLSATLIFCVITLTLAVVYQDELVISNDDYQKLRDELRLTEAREESEDEPTIQP